MCDGGRWPSENNDECRDCAVGWHRPSGSTTPCVRCPYGHHSRAGSASCPPCPGGTWQVEDQSSCQPCSVGTYRGVGNSFSCERCPAGLYAAAGSEACSGCTLWLLPASDQSRCSLDMQQLALSLGLAVAACAAFAMVAIGLFRNLRIIDVSLDRGKTLLRTHRQHFLWNVGRKSWPVPLRGCSHPGLDDKALRARRFNGFTLELLDVEGQGISERRDTRAARLSDGKGVSLATKRVLVAARRVCSL